MPFLKTEKTIFGSVSLGRGSLAFTMDTLSISPQRAASARLRNLPTARSGSHGMEMGLVAFSTALQLIFQRPMACQTTTSCVFTWIPMAMFGWELQAAD